ncbi:MAG TPA: alpha/beta fold hydrolase [Chloroflexota bacterium]|nr:alpha/beta fold hydrolase [Chloroflexota bacterium]
MFRPLKLALPVGVGIAAGGAVAGAAFAIAEYVVRQMTAPSRRRTPLNLGFTPFETGVHFEEVTLSGGHDSPIRGWLLLQPAPPGRGEKSAPTILACGGYRSQRSDVLGISSALWRAGYNVLMFDYTGYGDEPGPVTLGYWEMADARAALRYLRSRFPDAPLGVLGFSMGAAVAIMVAAREPDVRAVFADSPFTDQREIVRYQVGRKFRLSASQQGEWLARVVLPLVDRRLARLFGFRLSDVDPLRDVASLAPRPLALLHGEADTTIPVEHTRRMEAAARAAGVPVEAQYIPGAGHCQAYFFDRAGYCARATRFFASHVGVPVATPASPPSPPSAIRNQAPRTTERPLAALS